MDCGIKVEAPLGESRGRYKNRRCLGMRVWGETESVPSMCWWWRCSMNLLLLKAFYSASSITVSWFIDFVASSTFASILAVYLLTDMSSMCNIQNSVARMVTYCYMKRLLVLDISVVGGGALWHVIVPGNELNSNTDFLVTICNGINNLALLVIG